MAFEYYDRQPPECKRCGKVYPERYAGAEGICPDCIVKSVIQNPPKLSEEALAYIFSTVPEDKAQDKKQLEFLIGR